MAETTITSGLLLAASAIRSATAPIRSVFFSELPPYFCTSTVMDEDTRESSASPCLSCGYSCAAGRKKPFGDAQQQIGDERQ